jgi:hypothetical protein
VKGPRASLAALAAIVLLACGGSDRDAERDGGGRNEGDRDAAAPDAAAGLALELQTGEPGAFRPFEDGDVLRLQRGCQGSQHVFVSARVRGASEGPITLTLTIRRRSDGEPVSLPFELRLPFDERPSPDSRQETGLTPIVPVPGEVLGQEVTIEGRATDESGAEGRAVRYGIVRWGPDACG